MGKYLSFAKQCLQDFQPKVEERTGIRLEELVVRDPTNIPYRFALKGKDDDATMFTLPYHPYENIVFVNEKNCREDKLPVPYGITHEIVHKVHDKMMEGEVKKTKGSKILRRLWNVWKYKRFDKMRSFQEGFAEYVSLDYLVDIQNDHKTLREIAKKRRDLGSYSNFKPEGIPYERGYKFFRKVLYVIGEDNIFEVAKSPPMSEIEVKIPLLYILRKYPIKGIWYMPDFLFRSLKTKIIKKICGYVDFDFPCQKRSVESNFEVQNGRI